ncbi:hypothetical protein [Candidatus Nucleicultrix amoebiphila]|jgi:hypothetical protein|uniref:Uncharacterized protein n=1 Tax=Candidatus Nucleicultrix amoebiphila FS5 TaxID=1414854 RepID=A0A1W6N5R4_9PROT|nr:hypothetical protein [Candidatus Nucleicultrix amoebiphila]ARN85197.1 hypothetical protein GQ61_07775 [Candidatus Nucleicultrix amoebiphila FS5]
MKKDLLKAGLVLLLVGSGGTSVSFAAPAPLNEDQIEVLESMPTGDHPILPPDRQFTYKNQRSTQITANTLEATDESALEQTGIFARFFESVKLFILVNIATKNPSIIDNTDDELSQLANSHIEAYLLNHNSPRAKTFKESVNECSTRNLCEETIAKEELSAILREQKRELAAYIRMHSSPYIKHKASSSSGS